MSEGVYTFDLNGRQPTFTVLAQIATMLETHESVLITNAYKPEIPGAAAMHFGARMQKALEALEREESKT